MSWQPIATAPKDGTIMLVTNGVHVVLAENRYNNDDTRIDVWMLSQTCCECSDSVYPQPTHWMPLPEPPESQK